MGERLVECERGQYEYRHKHIYDVWTCEIWADAAASDAIQINTGGGISLWLLLYGITLCPSPLLCMRRVFYSDLSQTPIITSKRACRIFRINIFAVNFTLHYVFIFPSVSYG